MPEQETGDQQGEKATDREGFAGRQIKTFLRGQAIKRSGSNEGTQAAQDADSGHHQISLRR